MKYIKLCVVFSFLIYFAAAIGLKVLNLPVRLIIQENNLVETLSPILFLTASLLAIYLLVTKHFSDRLHFFWLIGIAGLGLLGFLDEISFGANYITMPTLEIEGVKIDAVHDIGILTYATLERIHSLIAIVILALIMLGLIAAFAIVVIKKRKIILSTLNNPRDYPLYFFLAVFVGCIGLAMFIDLDIIKIDILFVLEELLELNASLPLIFAALYIRSLSKGKVLLVDEITQPT